MLSAIFGTYSKKKILLCSLQFPSQKDWRKRDGMTVLFSKDTQTVLSVFVLSLMGSLDGACHWLR